MRISLICLLLLIFTAPLTADDRIDLRSGEQLRGQIVDANDQSVTLEHAILGRLVIPRADITAITRDGADAPPSDDESAEGDAGADGDVATGAGADTDDDASEATDQAGDGEVSDGASDGGPGPEDDSPESLWTSSLEVALSAREGRTRNADVRLAFHTERKTDDDTFKYDATYYTRSDRSGRTDHRVSTGAFWERPRQESRWSLFGQGRFEYDEFNAWDYRITGSTGVGYQLWNEMATDEHGIEFERLNVRLRGGGGFRREIGSPDEEFRPEGLFSAELSWRPVSRQRVGATSTYFQTLDDADDFRVVTNAEWEVAIDQMNGVNLKIGLAHEHQAETPPEVRKDDLYMYAALVLNF